jgi:TonB family protein
MCAPRINAPSLFLLSLTLCFFFASLHSPPLAAQESPAKLDAPAPKQQPPIVPLPKGPPPTPQPAIGSEASPEVLQDLQELAVQILNHIPGDRCRKKGCTILVTDFELPDGNVSRYGIQLGDALSHELATQSRNVHLSDRDFLHDSQSNWRTTVHLNYELARSLARSLGADIMVMGTTEQTGDENVQLSARAFDRKDRDWPGYFALIDFRAPKSAVDLSPVQSRVTLQTITSSSGETVFRSGVGGVSLPSCTYMPNPPYSEEARKEKISGAVITEAVINTRGTLEDFRILIGMPAGLNDTLIATMKTWRCIPGQKDGRPVPTIVQFQVNFRLY